ncbi:MAG: PAS domain S-box protein [Thermomicrobiales bacterium]
MSSNPPRPAAQHLDAPDSLPDESVRITPFDWNTASFLDSRGLFAAAADAMLVADENGHYLDANPAAEALLGYTRDELYILSVPDIVSRDRGWTEAEYARFMAQGFWRGQLEVRRKDGTLIPVEAAATVLTRSPVRTFLSTLRDMSERDRLERQLRLNDLRFRAALANSPVTVFEQDRDLRYTWIVNPAGSFVERNVIGRTDDDLLPAATAQVLTTIKRDVLETSISIRTEVTLVVAGRSRIFDLTVDPVFDVGDQVSGIICSAVDVTSRRLVEDELQRQAFLLDHAYDAIFAWEWNGPITYWNRGAERLYGFTKQEALGRLSHELLRTIHPTGLPMFLEALTRDGIWEGIVEHTHKSGHRLTVESRHQLLREHGHGLVLEANRDVTDRQRAEEERADFLDAVAHDIRNPLGTIIGRAQLLDRRLGRDAVDRDMLHADLAEIAAAAMRANGMLDELIDAARIRLGQPLELWLAPVDLVALAAAAVAVAQHQGTTERHTLNLIAPEPLIGAWDRARLARAIDNLLSNAIKYSPGGSAVTVTLTREEDQDAHSWAVVSVADEGVGIPADDLPSIFGRFRRGGNVAGLIHGSGIGLAAVHQIAAQHGGTISVESRVGEGSVFTMRLPLADG